MVRGRVVEIGGLIDREFQTLRSTVELGSRIRLQALALSTRCSFAFLSLQCPDSWHRHDHFAAADKEEPSATEAAALTLKKP